MDCYSYETTNKARGRIPAALSASVVIVVVGGGLGGPGLLREQVLVDVGHHAAASDCGAAQQLRQLLVVAHRQLDVAGHDAGLLVVASSVAGELKNLMHWGTMRSEGVRIAVWGTLFRTSAHCSLGNFQIKRK